MSIAGAAIPFPAFVGGYEHLPELAIAAALAWGAGLRLYLIVFVFGLAGYLGWWTLPEHLQVLQHPLVIAAAGFMALVEMFADKLPWLDSLWDAIHTFVRIPAGGALAAGAFGEFGAAAVVAAALLGGSLTALTHATKAGTRAAVNTSPEPFSNAALSLTEDVSVLGAVWLAIHYPLAFLALLLLFVVAATVLLRWLWRAFARVRSRNAAGS
jgi:hypothetical protein